MFLTVVAAAFVVEVSLDINSLTEDSVGCSVPLMISGLDCPLSVRFPSKRIILY